MFVSVQIVVGMDHGGEKYLVLGVSILYFNVRPKQTFELFECFSNGVER